MNNAESGILALFICAVGLVSSMETKDPLWKGFWTGVSFLAGAFLVGEALLFVGAHLRWQS